MCACVEGPHRISACLMTRMSHDCVILTCIHVLYTSCIHVRVYIPISMYTFACVPTYIHVCTYLCTYAYECIRIHVYIRISMNTYTCVHTYTNHDCVKHQCIHTYACARICITDNCITSLSSAYTNLCFNPLYTYIHIFMCVHMYPSLTIASRRSAAPTRICASSLCVHT